MKVFEILQTKAPVNENELIYKLKNCDWNYEYSMDERRQRRGHEAMAKLEMQVYELWKQNPAKAEQLWNEYSPFKTSMTPSFILRLEAQGR